MKGKLTVITLTSIVVYFLLITIFYFGSLFMVSWGGGNTWYLQLIAFLQDIPFRLVRDNGEIKMSLVFVNALFWTLCFSLILYLVVRFFFKKRSA